MTDPQVAEIVGKLTNAQREALIQWAQHEPNILGGYGLPHVMAGELVERVGVNHPIFGSHYRLTPLGLAVRHHLTQSGDTINDR